MKSMTSRAAWRFARSDARAVAACFHLALSGREAEEKKILCAGFLADLDVRAVERADR